MERQARISIIVLLGIMLSGCFGGIRAYSQNIKSQEARRDRLEKEIAILDGQLRAAASKSASALGKLSLASQKVAARKELVAESEKEISAYSRQIAAKEKEIAAAQARLDTLSAHYARLVRGAYKNRNAKIWYMYIIASDNLEQAFRRFGYLRDLSSQMKSQAEKIEEYKSVLEAEKAEIMELRKEAEQLKKRRMEDLGKLEAEEDEARKIVNQLNRDKSRYQSELKKKQNEVAALNREIDRIIRDAMGGKGGASSSKRKPVDYKLAKQFESNKGILPWPAEGPVVDRFGQHYHPVYTKIKLPFNNGMTIALKEGTPIKAIFDGEVKQIVVMPGFNKCVLVQHGNYFSFYCKIGSVTVKAGDKVKTGQVLGTVDTINGETQLHFQIWSGRTPQNPEIWLRP